MKTKKTVTALAWAWFGGSGCLSGVSTRNRAKDARLDRQTGIDAGLLCGPIVKIELPLPKAGKGKR